MSPQGYWKEEGEERAEEEEPKEERNVLKQTSHRIMDSSVAQKLKKREKNKINVCLSR